jgi:hypothetical protein
VEPISKRVALRYAAKAAETAESFAAAFFAKHPHLQRFAPRRVLDKAAGGSGSHPEARQSGNEIWLFPKFWHLDDKMRDFVFAHELGHYTQSETLPGSKFIDACKELDIDPWDTSSLPFGQGNMDEAFADSFATYFLDHGDLHHRYPKWETLVHRVVG